MAKTLGPDSFLEKNLNRTNLKIARENVGLSTVEATQKILPQKKVAQTLFPQETIFRNIVKEWETKSSTPTFSQLSEIAKIYDTSEFFFTITDGLRKNKPVNNREIKYRKLTTDTESRYILHKFINFLRIRQNFVATAMIEEGSLQNTLIGKGKPYYQKNDAVGLAHLITEQIQYNPQKKLQNKRLKHLQELLESQGVFIWKTIPRKEWGIEVSQMRGMYLENKYAPFIVLNNRDSRTAQMFTLAHELCHLLLNDEGITSTNDTSIPRHQKQKEEHFCDQFAASFLLPEDVFDKDYYSKKDIVTIASKYEISPLFAFYRLKSLHRISATEIKNIESTLKQEMTTNIEKQQNKKEDERFNPNPYLLRKSANGKLFNNMVLSLYSNKKITPTEVRKLTGVPLEKLY